MPLLMTINSLKNELANLTTSGCQISIQHLIVAIYIWGYITVGMTFSG